MYINLYWVTVLYQGDNKPYIIPIVHPFHSLEEANQEIKNIVEKASMEPKNKILMSWVTAVNDNDSKLSNVVSLKSYVNALGMNYMTEYVK